MSGLELKPAVAVAVAEQRQRQQFRFPGYDPGPIPFCRVCQRPVPYRTWTRYEGGFWGFTVRCHGELSGGLVASPSLDGSGILEVFCDEPPRVPEGNWWWVGFGGMRLQESPKYLRDTVRPGVFTPRNRRIAIRVMTVITVIGLSSMMYSRSIMNDLAFMIVYFAGWR